MTITESVGIVGFVIAALYLALSVPAYIKLVLQHHSSPLNLMSSQLTACLLFLCWAVYGYLLSNWLLAAAMILALILHLILLLNMLIFRPGFKRRQKT